MSTRPLGLVLVALAFGCAHAPPAAPPPVAASPADVATIEGLMTAFYDIVNVPPGSAPQWDRDRTLYVPWIHFVSIHEGKDGPKLAI
jgi:hypothetical protein